MTKTGSNHWHVSGVVWARGKLFLFNVFFFNVYLLIKNCKFIHHYRLEIMKRVGPGPDSRSACVWTWTRTFGSQYSSPYVLFLSLLRGSFPHVRHLFFPTEF